MKTHLVFIILLISILNLHAQNPNYALKTPETLEIIQVELGTDATLISLSIENRVKGGYFCADNNTFIITDKGLKFKLDKAMGIAICPDIYTFKNPGERLYFSLQFPPIPVGSSWIDLVEECGEMCFSILGITLDPLINERIDKGFAQLDAGNNKQAIIEFESLISLLEKSNHGILGSLYMNLYTLYENQGDGQKAGIVFENLINSSIPHKELYIQNIMKQK